MFLASAAILIASCTDEEVPAYLEGYEKVVVNAFLYEGEPVDDIRITRLITYEQTDSISNYLNHLQVYLSKGDLTYLLESYPGDTGCYHYTGDDLEIVSGDQFDLAFMFNDEKIRSTTIIPERPAPVVMNMDTIYLRKLVDFYDMMDLTRSELIELTWSNPDADYYYFVIESLDENAELINQIDTGDRPFGDRTGRFFGVTEPTDANFYQIQTMSLTYFGRYMVRVFRANDEFAEMFETSGQDSRNLNEPFSNITNGLGIFTGFTLDTIYFEVLEE
jgi:hypothetical protein